MARLTCQCPAALCIHLGIRRQEDIPNLRMDWTEEPLGTEWGGTYTSWQKLAPPMAICSKRAGFVQKVDEVRE